LCDQSETIQWPELLRSIPQQVEKAGQYSQGGLNGMGSGMAAGDRQGGLTGVSGLPGNAMEEQGTAGDCLGMFFGLGQANKQVPPVVDQGNEAAGQAAALEISGSVAAPAPLVLEFVETIFAIGTIAVQLRQGK